ncbi:MAG: MotE family protein [Limimaricola soesokkakensis]|uniref:MotE family protein n=1 Tax=Limimaricola soesokkakensis TaxID=1343159 RepID=UPI00405A3B55
MITPRPFQMVVGALALAGIAKASLLIGGVGMHAGPGAAPQPSRPGLFVSAANAAAGDPAPEPATEPAPAETVIPQSCAAPEEVLSAIATERGLLDEQRAALNDRASEIALAEETLAIETARLEELRGELEGLLTKIDEARQADVERLVALYVNMKPREAATIMNDLDIEVAVTVLGAMPERDAAPVLAAMNVVRAQAISMIILERSKLPGDQRLNGIRLQ